MCLDILKKSLGSGMARQAGEALDMAPRYREYAIAAQQNGETPLPQEAWLSAQKTQQRN